MTLTRRLPQSDEGRDRALTTAKNRKDNVAAVDMAITPATGVRLDAIQPSFKGKMNLRSIAEQGQSLASALVNASKAKAIMFISQFFRVFNFGVKREKYSAADRNFYNLPVNSENIPDVNTEPEVIQWGDRVVTGDANRIVAGGAAMANPDAAEVGVEVAAFNTANNNQGGKKTAFDHAQEAVETLRPEADAVIKKIWDEVETFYNEEPAPSMRRKVREWGGIYVSDITLTFHIHATDSANGNNIAGVVCELVQTNNTHSTDANGLTDIASKITGLATISFSHPDYVSQSIDVDLPEGQLEFTVNVALVHV